MTKVLIINGHPNPQSFNYALARAYANGAAAQAEVETLNLAELEFNPNLRFGYQMRTPWEQDLEVAVDQLKKADHWVWVFPQWWYSYPAIMKGFIDRVFLPGVTFAYQDGRPFPKKLMKGKTARMIITADSPGWYNRWFIGRPAIHQLKRGTLQFCGVKPVKVTYLAPVKGSSEAKRGKWLKMVERLGQEVK
ncbi:MAG TPA: NAD(P)H dehydrogenase [Cytophagales bacterium]|nr:NAD(P)H dehydrogenase [Cytophagales bacterium]HAA19917.1 NAD(P)H dehydrogenase [Cytophagales bacterium]HAP62655.1 NAD(P)H dehydrogenase [Cytophagales bacterium]